MFIIGRICIKILSDKSDFVEICEDDLLRLKHISQYLFIDENVILRNKVFFKKPYKVYDFVLIININAIFTTTVRSSIFVVNKKKRVFFSIISMKGNRNMCYTIKITLIALCNLMLHISIIS